MVLRLLRQLSIFFLLITSALPLVFSVVFVIHNKVNKRMMMQQLKQKNLTALYLSSTEFYFIESNEIAIDGRMFDIESIEEVEQHYYRVTGLFDEEEDKLASLLAKTCDNNLQSKLLLLFSFTGTIPATDWYNCFMQNRTSLSVVFYNRTLPFLSFPVVMPPPKA